MAGNAIVSENMKQAVNLKNIAQFYMASARMTNHVMCVLSKC